MAGVAVPKVVPVIHDTIYVAVHDTLVRVAQPLASGDISRRDMIGWGVTFFGILVAGTFALGAQWWRRRLDDKNAVRVLRNGMIEGLDAAIRIVPRVTKTLESHRSIQRRSLQLLDDARITYDRNKDNMVHWPHNEAKEALEEWFRDFSHTRYFMEEYAEAEPASRATQVVPQVTRLHLDMLKVLVDRAQALRESLKHPRPLEAMPQFERWESRRPATAAPAAPTAEGSSPGGAGGEPKQ